MSNAALVTTMSQILGKELSREELARRAEIIRYVLNAFCCQRVCDVPDDIAPDFVRLFKQKYMEADPVLRLLSVYEML